MFLKVYIDDLQEKQIPLIVAEDWLSHFSRNKDELALVSSQVLPVTSKVCDIP